MSQDNIKKMLAIELRLRARIPVVISGETGIGKTVLIEYFCKIKRVNYESWWSRTKDWAKKLVEGGEGQRDKAGKYRRLQ